MAKFSQRYGYTEIEIPFQHEDANETLRTALWNALSISLWDHWSNSDYSTESEQVEMLSKLIWINYLKRDLDELPTFKYYQNNPGAYNVFKTYFSSCEWYEVFDFIEFILKHGGILVNEDLVKWLNQLLQTENSAYRIIGFEIAEITDNNEIKAIKDALEHPDAPVRAHIQAALEMLSRRTNPDYRNSIKESISAVEATCRLITKANGATLGEALKKIPTLHPALQKSLLSLYGFTNDQSGIMHSLLEESNLTYKDAKFMLSVCSAFVSYLRLNQP